MLGIDCKGKLDFTHKSQWFDNVNVPMYVECFDLLIA